VPSNSSRTAFTVLAAVATGHLINDLLQSLLPAIYPILQRDFGLAFWQVGLITFANQATASLLQPFVGHFFDKRPYAASLATGMSITFVGLLLLAWTPWYWSIVIAAAMVGIGSAVFHPEASRVARLASGTRHGFGQSLFQTGGNGGTALGPLLAAFIVLPFGRPSVAGVAVVALVGIAILWKVGHWHAARSAAPGVRQAAGRTVATARVPLTERQLKFAMAILITLVISKAVYLASMVNFYMFFLIDKFGVSIQSAQLHLFAFLAASALGTFAGGPIGDRVGRKVVIWVSILGVLPFTIALPYANLFWSAVLTVVIGLILSSAFSAILVYAQELVPGRVGLVAGLFFGFSFGIGGLAAAGLGWLADVTSLQTVFRLCAFLPALGMLTAWLPRESRPAIVRAEIQSSTD
jgi:FSR family fosmidomycin resistance protein-like MFS transporter